MSISKQAYRMLILSVLVALSVGLVVATNSVNVSSKMSSNVGSNMTGNVNITDINFAGANNAGADQWLKIVNYGKSSISLNGWKVTNMENQTYSFPTAFSIGAGAMVKIHSGKGNDTSTDLYNSAAVWNKKSDTAILKDASVKIVSEYKYPTFTISGKVPANVSSKK
jgi:hypothetical protein